MNVVPSGFGKDKIIEELSYYIFKNSNDYMIESCNTYYIKKKQEVHEKATELYPNNIKLYTNYLKEHKPRRLEFEMGRGTYEGFYAESLTISRNNYGCLCLIVPEFGDFISSLDRNNIDAMTILKDGYDGELKSKVTQGNGVQEKVSKTPINCMLWADSIAERVPEGKNIL